MMDTSQMPGLVNPQYSGVPFPQNVNTPPDQSQSINGPNMPMNSQEGNQYAHGGDVHPDAHFILAHFNKPELHMLDEAQGVRTHVPGTHTRIYKKLDNMVKGNDEAHGHYMDHVAQHHAHHYARGESVKQMADEANKNGRYGDTDTAYITPYLKQILDHARGGESLNPHDNKPEYFGLNIGGALSGLRSAAGKVGDFASNAWNTAKNAYNSINNSDIGHGLIEGAKGAGLAALGGGDSRAIMAAGAGRALEGQSGPAADMARTAASTYGAGGDMNQIARNTARTGASYLPESVGRVANAGINSIGSGQSLGQTGLNMAKAGASGMTGVNGQLVNAGINSAQNLYDKNRQPASMMATA